MRQKPVLDDTLIDILKIFIIAGFIILYILNTGSHEL
jgi:hypothetical protein